MAATSRVFFAAFHEQAGIRKVWPAHGLQEPFAQSTQPGSGRRTERITIPAGEKVLIYDRAVHGAFTHAYARVIGTTSLRSAVQWADAANTANSRQWAPWANIGAGSVVAFPSQHGLTHATAANLTGSDGNGFPALWSDGSKVVAVCNKIAVENTDDEDDAVLEIITEN